MPFLTSKFVVFYEHCSLYSINLLKGSMLLLLSAFADAQGILESPQKIFVPQPNV